MKPTFHKMILAGMVAGFAFLTGAHAAGAVTLTHVHGLAYSTDGASIMIPSHHGLAVYENGKWRKAPGPAHDFMGFAATGSALYSSGHPAPGSGLTNPFGLIKSIDGGKNWKKLGLEGESDFHTLATSHGTNAVYVVNPAPNSRMKQAGIFFTKNDGLSWQHAAAQGLGSKLNALAVHPTDAGIVAAAAADGLYLSRDSAARFEQLAGGRQVLSATFDLDGQHLWFGGFDGKPSLQRIVLKPGSTAQALSLPALTEDAVAYIAQNPARRDELAIATFKRSVFVSKDGGRTWTAIAKDGATHER